MTPLLVKLRVMKVLLIIIVLLLTNLTAVNPLASTTRPAQDNQVTCEEARVEVARFNNVFSTLGSGKGGDPWRSIRYSSAAGESFWEGFNFYKSESRFKKSVRQISENVEGLIGWTPLFDERGQQIGQRVVKETRTDGRVTSVLIQRITDRAIQGIRAPSLKLALTVEKANITCRAETGSNAN